MFDISNFLLFLFSVFTPKISNKWSKIFRKIISSFHIIAKQYHKTIEYRQMYRSILTRLNNLVKAY